ncbi:hypothetical protein E1218_02490 [Kribbella turkmenica]|uniref:Transcriptional regulator, CdaR n=1 Tax=Kribbella turkmenica TaxID=2530375 RepID=A0A4R4XHN6_9ACTN|nr:PucR family transcriptional regulator [Kribbella turkmenica]TDD30012.1 hypothetical protein E1218_02490 [Kribbella turkmenica]
MSVQLQSIVEKLAAQLNRAVAIDDPHLRLLAHSPHDEPVDQVRIDSVMHRRVPDEVTRYVLSLGIDKAAGAVRLPANPALGMWSRVCVPIRGQDLLLGYLFFIDSDDLCSADDLALAESAAHMAGLVLYQERLLAEVEHARERELGQDLLNGDLQLRQSAAAELIERGFFARDTTATVMVVQAETPSNGHQVTSATDLHLAIASALEDARQNMPHRKGLHIARPGHGVVIVDTSTGGMRSTQVASLAEHLRASLIRRLASAGGGPRVVVGIGEPHDSLVEAEGSYSQALAAARVSSIIPSLGDLTSWAGLGIYQVLSRMPVEELTADVLHTGVKRLLAEARHRPLLETVEVYLDNAGDSLRTAEKLSIHRTSLYYRLEKAASVAGVDLRNGHDRLALHLSLKVARLCGALEPPRTQAR